MCVYRTTGVYVELQVCTELRVSIELQVYITTGVCRTTTSIDKTMQKYLKIGQKNARIERLMTNQS